MDSGPMSSINLVPEDRISHLACVDDLATLIRGESHMPPNRFLASTSLDVNT
jgi:hypothetical protein